MANRFWVGGTGDWDGSTTHWSTTSGGSNGASAPSTSDDVFFDGNSGGGTVTLVTSQRSAHHLDFTGFTGTLTDDGNAWLRVTGSLTFGSGMTVNMAGQLHLYPSGAGTYTITTNGVEVVATVISSKESMPTGVTYNFADDYTGRYINFGGSDCIWNTNGHNFTLTEDFIIDNNGTPVANLGDSVIDCRTFNCYTNSTVDTGTSVIKVRSTASYGAQFYGGGNAYYQVEVYPYDYNSVYFGDTGNSFEILKVIGNNSLSCEFVFTESLTITTLYLQGYSATNRLFVKSDLTATQRTLTVGTVDLDNVDFQNIVGAGAATWSGNAIGDCGNNSGITFTTPDDLFWVGYSGGNWNDTANWSTSSGGSSGARVPLPQDTAYLDANSITSSGRTITVNVPRVGVINLTGLLNSPTFDLNFDDTQTTDLEIYGSLTLISGITFTQNSVLYFSGSATVNLTTAGKTLSDFYINLIGAGKLVLQDDLTMGANSQISHYWGEFDLNDQDFTGTSYYSSDGNRILRLGSGIIYLDSFTFYNSDTYEFYAETSTISTINIYSGDVLTFYDVYIRYSVGNSTYFGYSYNFHQLEIEPGAIVQGENGITLTADIYVIVGTVANTIKLFAGNGIATFEVADAGVDYLVDDYVIVTGNGLGGETQAYLLITEVDEVGGVVAATVDWSGVGHTIANDVSTTADGGAGTGFTINILTLDTTQTFTLKQNTGSVRIEYVELANCIAFDATNYRAYNSVDGGGNTNWIWGAFSDRSARLTGEAQANSERSAHLVGNATDNSERGAHLVGEDTSNSERGAKTTGTLSVSDQRSATITGQDTANSERSGHLVGEAQTSSERSGKLTGKDTSSSERSGHLVGEAAANSERSAKLTGKAADTSERSAKITGKDAANSERGAHLVGEAQATSERGAKLTAELSTNDERAAKIHGQILTTDERGGHLVGEAYANSERSATLRGELTDNSERGGHLVGEDYDTDERSAHLIGEDYDNSERAAILRGQIAIAFEMLAHLYGEDYANSERGGKTHGQATAFSDRGCRLVGKAIIGRPTVLPGKYGPTILGTNRGSTPLGNIIPPTSL